MGGATAVDMARLNCQLGQDLRRMCALTEQFTAVTTGWIVQAAEVVKFTDLL